VLALLGRRRRLATVNPPDSDDQVVSDAAAEIAVPDVVTLGVRLDQLLDDASRYATHARAEATLRGYRSDWTDFTSWCAQMGLEALPASPATLAAYMAALASMEAAVGTIARRLSSIGHYHRAAGVPDPSADPAVRYVMAGIRRQLGRRPDQATPLMPPLLFDAVQACPSVYVGGGGPEPHLRGLRDRAILLVGFVGALRRSELASADLEELHDHPLGLVLDIPTSKTHQDPTQVADAVVLPRSRTPEHCPVVQLNAWIDAAGITQGPIFRGCTPRGNKLASGDRRLTGERINTIVQDALRRTGVDPDAEDYSAHSLRAGFVTYASARGASDRAIARQTRHRDPTSVAIYTRHQSAWTDNAATQLGL